MDTYYIENMNVLESYLDSVINSLSNIKDSNAGKNIKRVIAIIDKFERLRTNLLQNYDREELRRASQHMNRKVKQILQIYDNIIEQNKNEQEKVKNELKDLINRKKLNNYL